MFRLLFLPTQPVPCSSVCLENCDRLNRMLSENFEAWLRAESQTWQCSSQLLALLDCSGTGLGAKAGNLVAQLSKCSWVLCRQFCFIQTKLVCLQSAGANSLAFWRRGKESLRLRLRCQWQANIILVSRARQIQRT